MLKWERMGLAESVDIQLHTPELSERQIPPANVTGSRTRRITHATIHTPTFVLSVLVLVTAPFKKHSTPRTLELNPNIPEALYKTCPERQRMLRC